MDPGKKTFFQNNFVWFIIFGIIVLIIAGALILVFFMSKRQEQQEEELEKEHPQKANFDEEDEFKEFREDYPEKTDVPEVPFDFSSYENSQKFDPNEKDSFNVNFEDAFPFETQKMDGSKRPQAGDKAKTEQVFDFTFDFGGSQQAEGQPKATASGTSAETASGSGSVESLKPDKTVLSSDDFEEIQFKKNE